MTYAETTTPSVKAPGASIEARIVEPLAWAPADESPVAPTCGAFQWRLRVSGGLPPLTWRLIEGPEGFSIRSVGPGRGLLTGATGPDEGRLSLAVEAEDAAGQRIRTVVELVVDRETPGNDRWLLLVGRRGEEERQVAVDQCSGASPYPAVELPWPKLNLSDSFRSPGPTGQALPVTTLDESDRGFLGVLDLEGDVLDFDSVQPTVEVDSAFRLFSTQWSPRGGWLAYIEGFWGPDLGVIRLHGPGSPEYEPWASRGRASPPIFRRDDQWAAFDEDIEGTSTLHLVRLDGPTDIRRVDTSANAYRERWVGERVLVTVPTSTAANAARDLISIEPETGLQRVLTRIPESAWYRLFVAPDERTVVIRARTDTASQLQILRGPELQDVAELLLEFPIAWNTTFQWSPDGSFFMFRVRSDDGRLLVASRVDRPELQVIDQAFDFRTLDPLEVLPDARRILVSWSIPDESRLIELDTGEKRPVFGPHPAPIAYRSGPLVAPDGRTLALLLCPSLSEGACLLEVYDVATGQSRRRSVPDPRRLRWHRDSRHIILLPRGFLDLDDFNNLEVVDIQDWEAPLRRFARRR